MDWITGMQNAINYIDDNLTDKLDYGKISETALSSTFQFQRMFDVYLYLCNTCLYPTVNGQSVFRRSLIDDAHPVNQD